MWLWRSFISSHPNVINLSWIHTGTDSQQPDTKENQQIGNIRELQAEWNKWLVMESVCIPWQTFLNFKFIRAALHKSPSFLECYERNRSLKWPLATNSHFKSVANRVILSLCGCSFKGNLADIWHLKRFRKEKLLEGVPNYFVPTDKVPLCISTPTISPIMTVVLYARLFLKKFKWGEDWEKQSFVITFNRRVSDTAGKIQLRWRVLGKVIVFDWDKICHELPG